LSIRVLVSSTCPDKLNTNYAIRSFVTRGFEELEGSVEVVQVAYERAASRITSFRPDIVLLVGGLGIDSTDYLALRKACDATGSVLCFWLHDDPYEFDYAFKINNIADVVFTNDSWALHHYDHHRVYHLPLAADPKLHLRPILPADRRNIGLFFCGVGYKNRVDLLRKARKTIMSYKPLVLGNHWPSDLKFAQNKRIPPNEMADLAQHAILTLNIGRDLDVANKRFRLPASTPGPRTFEVALSGSAQIYFTNGLEITDYFQPDSEMVLFDNVAQFSAILDWAREEPEHFVKIAEAAQRKVLDFHTYKHRANTIIDSVSDLIPSER
jgi:spore maturation protein CgeB